MERGKPSVLISRSKEKFQRLLQGIPETCGIKAGCVSLKAGESVGGHVTDAKEEAIIILKGRARITCGNDSAMVAGENALVYIPPETRHDVTNISRTTLRYIYVTSPVTQSSTG